MGEVFIEGKDALAAVQRLVSNDAGRIKDGAIKALINVLVKRLQDATHGQLEHYKNLEDFQDRVTGLELGADDYIIKPFDPAEVVARIRARLRAPKAVAQTHATARFNGWTAHFDRYLLTTDDGREVSFSHAEGEVLRLFLEAPKRVISRQQMQETLGGGAGESFDRAMDVRISRLRTKLGEDPKNPRLIRTIYGAGYIFLGEVTWN